MAVITKVLSAQLFASLKVLAAGLRTTGKRAHAWGRSCNILVAAPPRRCRAQPHLSWIRCDHSITSAAWHTQKIIAERLQSIIHQHTPEELPWLDIHHRQRHPT
jgi:hypothetical protein